MNVFLDKPKYDDGTGNEQYDNFHGKCYNCHRNFLSGHIKEISQEKYLRFHTKLALMSSRYH